LFFLFVGLDGWGWWFGCVVAWCQLEDGVVVGDCGGWCFDGVLCFGGWYEGYYVGVDCQGDFVRYWCWDYDCLGVW